MKAYELANNHLYRQLSFFLGKTGPNNHAVWFLMMLLGWKYVLRDHQSVLFSHHFDRQRSAELLTCKFPTHPHLDIEMMLGYMYPDADIPTHRHADSLFFLTGTEFQISMCSALQ